MNLDHFPNTTIFNDEVKMKVFLPDAKNGLYRATRFDWSGLIGSAQYKGHEYFGYWKITHDPLCHEDLLGPAEGFIKSGLGYDEAKIGDEFIRIGVGILEKDDEEYDWIKTYKIVDHGKWKIDQGIDWISFTHEIQSDIGYSYIYEKVIQLKNNGFKLIHTLKNIGTKRIMTDQFNHNFFRIDEGQTGTGFTVELPYKISTINTINGKLKIKENTLHFLENLNDESVFLQITGFGMHEKDNQFIVTNNSTGASVSCKIDKPQSDMVFWAIKSTLCPEPSIEISVDPGKDEKWISDYTFHIT